MEFSSQAGLATLTTESRPELTATTPSGIQFHLVANAEGDWVVDRINNVQGSANAQSLMGSVFTVGDNPYVWPQGYAQLIQQGVNNKAGLHSAYGIAAPAPIITEVPIS